MKSYFNRSVSATTRRVAEFGAVSVSKELEQRIELLQAADIAAKKHSGKGLLDHLLGTRNLLEQWGARPSLCDAGLFHSIYGTEAYTSATLPISQRAEVEKLIGQEAEAVAWLFCAMRRETLVDNVNRSSGFGVANRLTQHWIPVSAQQFSDLVNLLIANALEVLLRSPREQHEAVQRAVRMDLLPFRSVAMSGAQQAIDVLLEAREASGRQKWWQVWKSFGG